MSKYLAAGRRHYGSGIAVAFSQPCNGGILVSLGYLKTPKYRRYTAKKLVTGSGIFNVTDLSHV